MWRGFEHDVRRHAANQFGNHPSGKLTRRLFLGDVDAEYDLFRYPVVYLLETHADIADAGIAHQFRFRRREQFGQSYLFSEPFVSRSHDCISPQSPRRMRPNRSVRLSHSVTALSASPV